MKLLKKLISTKDGQGKLLLRPDTSEDLWHLYHLIAIGDGVRSTTLRKVVKESSTGSVVSHKQRLQLAIRVDRVVEFDPVVEELRVAGTVFEENPHVRLGAHHTLTLELHQNVSIEKDVWDQVCLDRIDEALHPERQADVAAVVLHTTNGGLAHVCLLTGALTIVKAKIEATIPKKRTIASAHEKALNKFFNAIYQAIVKHIDFSTVQSVLLGSPGFVKDDFLAYLQAEAIKRHDKVLAANSKSKFVLCRASSGHKHALNELLSDPAILSQLTATKVAQEVQVLQRFMQLLHANPDQAYYGYDHVAKAQYEHAAIEVLLVTDEWLRNVDVPTRKKYVTLVEAVRNSGGKVHVFSSMHVTGQQLQQVAGVAAILRYGVPDLEELEELAAEQQQPEDVDEPEYEKDDTEKRILEDIADMGL